MNHEKSFGVIPLKHQQGQWKVLLINHKKGSFWAFPKGHAEKGETSLQTAERELHEETGLSITRILAEETLSETYWFRRGSDLIHKTVLYYIAEVHGKIVLQEGEVCESRWVNLAEAEQWITFDESKRIVREVQKIIQALI